VLGGERQCACLGTTEGNGRAAVVLAAFLRKVCSVVVISRLEARKIPHSRESPHRDACPRGSPAPLLRNSVKWQAARGLPLQTSNRGVFTPWRYEELLMRPLPVLLACVMASTVPMTGRVTDATA